MPLTQLLLDSPSTKLRVSDEMNIDPTDAAS